MLGLLFKLNWCGVDYWWLSCTQCATPTDYAQGF